MNSKNLVIAIDGPAGSGKSSTAKALASRLKLPYLDTGAMYRALTLQAMKRRVPWTQKERLVALSKSARIRFEGDDAFHQRVFLDDADVTEAIREPGLTQNVFHVAQEPRIRREMVRLQRRLGRSRGAVMEGRDIGTVVFPDADYKFYFEADESLRARRRHEELRQAGKTDAYEDVLQDLRQRDRTDFERKEGPLKKAPDAIRLDTTALTIDETVDKIIALIQSNPLPKRDLKGDIFYGLIKIVLFTLYKTFFRFKAFGTENVPHVRNRRGVILAPNHASYLDPPLMGISLPRRVTYLAKDYLFRKFFVGWVLRSISALPIKTEADDFKSIRSLLRILREGKCVVVFPEGTRSPDGNLQPPESGIGFLAVKSQAWVVPIYIDGAYDAFPKGAKMFRPRPIRVYFGEPMLPALTAPEKHDPAHYAAVSEEIMGAIRKIKEGVKT